MLVINSVSQVSDNWLIASSIETASSFIVTLSSSSGCPNVIEYLFIVCSSVWFVAVAPADKCKVGYDMNNYKRYFNYFYPLPLIPVLMGFGEYWERVLLALLHAKIINLRKAHPLTLVLSQ